MESYSMIPSEEQKTKARDLIRSILAVRGVTPTEMEATTVTFCGDAVATLSVGLATYRKMIETSTAQLVTQVSILRLMLKGLLSDTEIEAVLSEAGIIEKGKPAVISGTQLVQ